MWRPSTVYICKYLRSEVAKHERLSISYYKLFLCCAWIYLFKDDCIILTSSCATSGDFRFIDLFYAVQWLWRASSNTYNTLQRGQNDAGFLCFILLLGKRTCAWKLKRKPVWWVDRCDGLCFLGYVCWHTHQSQTCRLPSGGRVWLDACLTESLKDFSAMS